MESNTSPKRLYRSRHDKMLAGVCGGLADYFGMSSTLIRILFVLFTLFGCAGLIAYITAMILVPVNPEHEKTEWSAEVDQELRNRRHINYSLFWGIVLIVFGIVLFLNEMYGWHFRHFWRYFDWDFAIPVGLILIGLFLIMSRTRLNGLEHQMKQAGATNEFRRGSRDKKIWGVCSGLAAYANMDVSVVRILWVVLTFLVFPVGIIAYILIALLTPDEENNKVIGSKTVNP